MLLAGGTSCPRLLRTQQRSTLHVHCTGVGFPEQHATGCASCGRGSQSQQATAVASNRTGLMCCFPALCPRTLPCASLVLCCVAVQADVGTAGAGGGRAIELPQAACLNPLQYIQGLAKAITGGWLDWLWVAAWFDGLRWVVAGLPTIAGTGALGYCPHTEAGSRADGHKHLGNIGAASHQAGLGRCSHHSNRHDAFLVCR